MLESISVFILLKLVNIVYTHKAKPHNGLVSDQVVCKVQGMPISFFNSFTSTKLTADKTEQKHGGTKTR